LGIEKVTAVAVALVERKVVFLETIVQISNLEDNVGLALEVVDLTAEHLVQPQSRVMHNPFNLLQFSFPLHSQQFLKLKNYLVFRSLFLESDWMLGL
jgi:hypothetical protein